MLGAEELLRVRMYTGFRSLAEGLAKNVVDMVGGVGPTLAAAVLSGRWSSAGRRLSCRSGVGGRHPAALVVALAGSLSLLGMHLAGARHFRIPFWYGFLFPLGYTLTAAVALYAVLRHIRGVVIWKGRAFIAGGKTTLLVSGGRIADDPRCAGVRSADDRRRIAVAIGVAAAVLLIAYPLRYVLLPFAFAGGLAFATAPAVRWLKRRFRFPHVAAVLAVFVPVCAGLRRPSLLDKHGPGPTNEGTGRQRPLYT